MDKEPLSYVDKIAIELFGATPKGTLFGMPLMVDPNMPNDRLRIVDPLTGRYTDFPIP